MSDQPPEPNNPKIAANPLQPRGLIIRARSSGDAEGVARLHNLPGYRCGTLRIPYHGIDEIRRSIDAQPANVTALVAVLEGEIVGDIGMTRFAGRRAHAASIGMGVDDAHAGRGIGRALLGAIIEFADHWLNLRRLELTVFTDNQPALALYRKVGFEVEGTHTDFAFRDGVFVDAHAMARIRT